MVLTLLKAAVLAALCTNSTTSQHVKQTASSSRQPSEIGTRIDSDAKRDQDSKPLDTDTLVYDPAALQRACQHIAAFSSADDLRGGLDFALTCALWMGSFMLGRWLLPHLSFTNWWGWALGCFWLLLRVGSSVRVYVQMHDLIHSSTFRKRWMNEWAAALTALIVPVDPADYKRVHSQHHAHTGMEIGAGTVPWWFSWAMMGIEYHHIHHANARVPCYRLKECHDSAPAGTWEALGVWKLQAVDGFHTMFLSLWDPQQRCYVPFPAWKWATDPLTRISAHK